MVSLALSDVISFVLMSTGVSLSNSHIQIPLEITYIKSEKIAEMSGDKPNGPLVTKAMYDFDSNILYLPSNFNENSPIDMALFAHEYTHFLQDQSGQVRTIGCLADLERRAYSVQKKYLKDHMDNEDPAYLEELKNIRMGEAIATSVPCYWKSGVTSLSGTAYALLDYVTRQMDLPPIAVLPAMKRLPEEELREKNGNPDGNILALYDYHVKTIYIEEGLDIEANKNVLVHELTHYVQDYSGVDFQNTCVRDIEMPAYTVEKRWMEDNGLKDSSDYEKLLFVGQQMIKVPCD